MASSTASKKVEGLFDYPAVSGEEILKTQLIGWIRGPAIATFLLIFGLAPVYFHVVKIWPYSERALFVVGTMVVHAIVYFGMNGFFYVCDTRGWLQQYKLPRNDKQVPPDELVNKTVTQAIKSQLLMQPLTAFLIWPIFQYCGTPSLAAPLPSAFTIYWQILVCTIVNEAGFYWSHRLLHTKWLYARVHKQHHEYTGSIGFAAEYAHPFEALISNQLPTVAGVMFFGFHCAIWWMWLAWRLYNTYETHSGYSFKNTLLTRCGLLYADKAAFHDFHHTANMGNYGTEFWDYIGGTIGAWTEHVNRLAAAKKQT